jgi:hypothetical protein
VSPSLGTPHRDEPSWPLAEGARERVIFLIDASSRFERRPLLSWIERNRPEGTATAQWDALDISPTRRRTRSVPLAKLEAMLSAPAIRCSRRCASRGCRARWTACAPRASSISCRAIRAIRTRCASASSRTRVRSLPDRRGRARARERAARTLAPRDGRRDRRDDRARRVRRAPGRARARARRAAPARRALQGPRFVREDILARPAFRGGVAQIARETGKSEARVAREAAGYLKEIAATHSTFAIDLMARLIRRWYTQGYAQGLRYDPAKLDRIGALAQRQSVVFLPTHKSNLDHLVLQYMLHENGLRRTTPRAAST